MNDEPIRLDVARRKKVAAKPLPKSDYRKIASEAMTEIRRQSYVIAHIKAFAEHAEKTGDFSKLLSYIRQVAP